MDDAEDAENRDPDLPPLPAAATAKLEKEIERALLLAVLNDAEAEQLADAIVGGELTETAALAQLAAKFSEASEKSKLRGNKLYDGGRGNLVAALERYEPNTRAPRES